LTTNNGQPNWEKILWTGIVSRAAREVTDRRKVVKDHAVPLAVLAKMLKQMASQGEITLERIATVVERYTVFGTITKEEDAHLRDQGLKDRMPDGFFEPGSRHFDDVLARYKVAGIKLD
jgi:hypothetical protein